MAASRAAEPPIDFGPRMKRLREQRGVELREVAEATKISVSALEALERNDISRLPGGIFSRGFVRAYAEQIGADPEAAVREFVERFPRQSVTEGSPFVSAQAVDTDPPSQLGRRIVLTLLVVVPVAAALAWAFLSRN